LAYPCTRCRLPPYACRQQTSNPISSSAVVVISNEFKNPTNMIFRSSCTIISRDLSLLTFVHQGEFNHQASSSRRSLFTSPSLRDQQEELLKEIMGRGLHTVPRGGIPAPFQPHVNLTGSSTHVMTLRRATNRSRRVHLSRFVHQDEFINCLKNSNFRTDYVFCLI